MIAAAASRAAATSLDGNVKLFFALANGLLDASIATWNAKRVQDTVRPITYIRWLYAGKKVKGWAGPGKGIVSEDGSAWIPYQEPGVVTPPFAEYTSGHSAFSGAAGQVFNRFAGTDTFKAALNVTIPAGSSTIEPKLVPSANTTLSFKSFTDATNQAGLSRRYGGIHFEQGDLNGRTLGSQVGDAAWAKALTYFNGTAVVPIVTTTTTTTAPPTTVAPTTTEAPTTTVAPTTTEAPTTTTEAPTTT
jgi:VCPO second helical-bundle domain